MSLRTRISLSKRARSLALDFLDRRTEWRRSLATMNQLQQARPAELQQFQMAQLRRLLFFALRNVPFYARKLKEVDPSSLNRLDDLSGLPLTRKEELRLNFASSISPLKNRGISNFTSGTTGEPFAFYEDKGSLGVTIASRFLFDSWTGVNSFEPRVRISAHAAGFWPRILFNESQIDLISVTPSRGSEIVETLQRRRPSLIICPPTAAAILCELPIPGHNLRSLVTTAACLTDSLRKKLESRWDVLVLDRYGLREISGYVAQECRRREGLHVNSGRVLLEIVRDGEVVSPGEQGEIVITDLNNYVMPFIRYATGDLAVRGDLCACGNAFPLIRKIVGRSFEYLRAKNGDLIPLSGFTDGFGAQFLNDVVQFRFIDKGVGKLDVKIVPARELSQETRIKMERWLKHFVDEVDIEVVESIPWDRRWR